VDFARTRDATTEHIRIAAAVVSLPTVRGAKAVRLVFKTRDISLLW